MAPNSSDRLQHFEFMRRGTGLAILALGLVAVAACGDSSAGTVDEAQIYAAVIRVVVPPEPTAEKVSQEIFIGSGGEEIGLELQSDILQELHEYEHVRFVDSREEAVDEDPPKPVKNEGVYVEFVTVSANASAARANVLRYVDENNESRMTIRLTRTGGAWVVEGIDETES
jgi:hypothetical protein